ncbi:hypothetical protein IZ6_08960 [Terrihabitans soli]|uniref:Uncharacterized protein n=1 Tax=Terrihabitans soli TaxID=708113 RepID=A0A6S6QSY2_9HYPH|nr:hypothetical protein [Terrihabitans soli]BCJ90161.1 hypothetical protein IZ6_08960 [Terrihabitans soli]
MGKTGRYSNRLLAASILLLTLCASGLPAAAEGVQMALFGWGKSKDGAPTPPPPPKDKEPMFCPAILVQPGTAAFIQYERGKEGDPTSVRYQANFNQFARECVDLGAEVGVRIGIAGRALVGPKGVPGQKMEVPIRFVVIDDQQKVVLSRVTRLQVEIPPGQTGITFTHVEDIGSLPFPGNAFRRWGFRVGFDSKPGGPQG